MAAITEKMKKIISLIVKSKIARTATTVLRGNKDHCSLTPTVSLIKRKWVRNGMS